MLTPMQYGARYGHVVGNAAHVDPATLLDIDDLQTACAVTEFNFVEMQPQGGNLRVQFDGSTSATATAGRIVQENEALVLFKSDATNLNLIADDTSAATTVWVQFSR